MAQYRDIRTPRYLKIQEFIAHQTKVNCIEIGRKSSGVLVTGGDDKKVNLWTIGTQTRTLSLTGHQTPVESVTFDSNEEVVAAGAVSGSIKVFDLDQAKVQRALTGHRSNVVCLDFQSTFGLLSGSMDTNIKMWDLRLKDAVVTCKGHTSTVRHVRFSPDGKWIASGSDNGEVKIFDIAAGKVIQDFTGAHTHAISGLQFHPHEYLMATASADKTVKVWDLETFQMLESTPPEATGIRAIAFHPDGRHLFSALQDGLRVWQWEPPPAFQHDNVDVPWSKVSDITLMRDKNKLVGCSFYQTAVGLWVVDLKDVRPFGNVADSGPAEPSYGRERAQSGGVDRYGGAQQSQPNYQDFALRRQAQGSVGSAPQAAPAPARPAVDPISYGLQQMALNERRGSGAAAGVRPSGPASPDHLQRAGSGAARYGDAGISAGRGVHAEVATSMGQAPSHSPIRVPAPVPRSVSMGQGQGGSRPDSAGAGAHDAGSRPGMVSIACGVGDSLLRNDVEPGQLQRMAQAGRDMGVGGAPPPGLPRAQSQGSRAAPGVGVAAGGHASWDRHDASAPPARQSSSTSAPNSAGAAAAAAGIRGSAGSGLAVRGAGAGGGQGPRTDIEAITDILGRSDDLKASMLNRLNNIRTMRNFVGRGDLRGAAGVARRCSDAVVAADVLGAAFGRRGFGDMLTLDVLPDLVPVLESVLSLAHERHVQVALDISALITRAFAPTIREVCGQGAAINARCVDMAFEQRKSKCEMARMVLQGLQTKLAFVARTREGSPLGARAGDLAAQLAGL